MFVDGQTFVSTKVGGAVGLQFATLDKNLWHVTTERADDPGHTGAYSFYFGENADNTTTASGIGRRYDLLGGAQGSLVSEPFNLEGYAATDLPALYFNYYLLTEGTTGRDAVPRVPSRTTAGRGPRTMGTAGLQPAGRVERPHGVQRPAVV